MIEENPGVPGQPPSQAKNRRLAAMRFFRTGLQKLRQAWPPLRWVLLRFLGVLGMFLVLVITVTGFAGWYTSRPRFCASCHIMEPYYVSWQDSKHKDVSCIECHFAPGFGGKVRGKLLGLVQLAKYVTASEGPRPAAEIPDESCLRSGCHERRLLSGRVEFQGVPFDHTPHLGELRRGKKLRCTSCHSQIVQGKHMTVTASTCFLCHFKEGLFNEGLGACNRCHQIPDKQFDLGGGIMFTHNLAYDRGVDCENCHGDLVRGKGEVPRERCMVCHNRVEDLKRIDDHEFMHRNHVTDHKIDCLECHLAIQHSLDRDKIVHAGSDCTSCHPDHHRTQVDLLRGVGAKTLPTADGGMTVVGVACRTCHRFEDKESPKGTLWRASAEACVACHDASAAPKLLAYETELKAAIKEMESAAGRLDKALKASSLDQRESEAVASQLEAVKHDLNFLRVGNGIHNIHYATTLTGRLLERVLALCRQLKVAEPKATLPRRVEGLSNGHGTKSLAPKPHK